MESMLQYVADVEQFAKLPKLMEAIGEVAQLVNDTKDFIVKYYSQGELCMFIILSFRSPKITSTQGGPCVLLSHRPLAPSSRISTVASNASSNNLTEAWLFNPP